MGYFCVILNAFFPHLKRPDTIAVLASLVHGTGQSISYKFCHFDNVHGIYFFVLFKKDKNYAIYDKLLYTNK